MQSLNQIVKQYLEMKTNNALMITGEWGTGKTHYFKNVLKSEIANTPLFGNDTKNTNPF